MQYSQQFRTGDYYQTLTTSFCDGLEVKVGKVQSDKATWCKSVLTNYLHGEQLELLIKNIQITARGQLSYIWFTFAPETTPLTPRTMTFLLKLV